MYPTAFGKPATVPSPGCVCSHALGVCVCVCVRVCVCVCVFVCPHVLGRCNDASFHRCIRRFTDSNDASNHSLIHQCIKCVRCGSLVILFRYFSLCCAVVWLISRVGFGVILSVPGSIVMSFWCLRGSCGIPVASRGPREGPESKM